MYDYYEEFDPYDEDGIAFGAFSGEGSALRAASASNPRNLPCPTCGWPDMLTAEDRSRGYQCDACADACERGGEIYYYEGDDD